MVLGPRFKHFGLCNTKTTQTTNTRPIIFNCSVRICKLTVQCYSWTLYLLRFFTKVWAFAKRELSFFLRFLSLCAVRAGGLHSGKLPRKARLPAAVIALLVQTMRFPVRQINAGLLRTFQPVHKSLPYLSKWKRTIKK